MVDRSRLPRRRRCVEPGAVRRRLSSAIVGAATLAQEFAAAHGSGGDWAAAFARYERRHRRVVAPNVRGFGVASRFIVPATAGGIAARNLLIRVGAVFNRPGGAAQA